MGVGFIDKELYSFSSRYKSSRIVDGDANATIWTLKVRRDKDRSCRLGMGCSGARQYRRRPRVVAGLPWVVGAKVGGRVFMQT